MSQAIRQWRLRIILAGFFAYVAGCNDNHSSPGDRVNSVAPCHYEITHRLSKTSELTWDVSHEPVPPDESLLATAFDRASKGWIEAGPFSFRRISEGSPDVLVLLHANGHATCDPWMPEFGDLGHTLVRDGRAEIHLNAVESWTLDGAAGSMSLSATIAHELGHVLGLGHSRDPAALMAPAYDPKRIRPQRSDRAALETLYGGPTLGPLDLELTWPALEAGRRELVLRGLKTGAEPKLAVFDLDSDGIEVVYFWTPSAKSAALRVLHLDQNGAVTALYGPIHGVADGARDLFHRRTESGESCLLVPLGSGYRVFRLDHLKRPLRAWGHGQIFYGPTMTWTDDEGKNHVLHLGDH